MKQHQLVLCSGPLGAPYGDGHWTRVDADPVNKPDILSTLPPLPAVVKDKKWTHIALIHGIEHFLPWVAKVLLRECYEVLEERGMLILEQPNLNFCAQNLLTPDETIPHDFAGQFDMAGIYGDPNHKHPGMMHHWGYSPRTLTEELQEAGFSVEKIVVLSAQFHKPNRDFRIEATK